MVRIKFREGVSEEDRERQNETRKFKRILGELEESACRISPNLYHSFRRGVWNSEENLDLGYFLEQGINKEGRKKRGELETRMREMTGNSKQPFSTGAGRNEERPEIMRGPN